MRGDENCGALQTIGKTRLPQKSFPARTLQVSGDHNYRSAIFKKRHQAEVVGVGERWIVVVEVVKLTPLLRLKYHNSISDALADLGPAEDIGQVFIGFQKYLYQHQPLA